MLNIYNGVNSNQTVPAPSPKPAATARKSKQPAFLKYEDPTGEFTTAEFKYSLWYVKHKLLLYRLTLIGLTVFSAVAWAFSIWRWADYAIVGIDADRRLGKELSRFSDQTILHDKFSAAALSVIDTSILPGGVNKYDAVAAVANPNDHFRVSFDYHFIVDGNALPTQHTFLLAGETRPVVYFGIEGTAAPGSAELVLENINWQRVPARLVGDPLAWQAQRLNFVTDAFVSIPPNPATGIAAHVVQFKLSNRGSSGYRAPTFYVGFLFQDSLVGIMPLRLPQLGYAETAQVDLRSFVSNLQVSGVKIFPLIDVYDREAYLPPPS